MVTFNESFSLLTEAHEPAFNTKEILDNLYKTIFAHMRKMGPTSRKEITNIVDYELHKAYGDFAKTLSDPLVRALVHDIMQIADFNRRDPFIAYRKLLRLDYVDKIDRNLQTGKADPKDYEEFSNSTIVKGPSIMYKPTDR
jgi:hypothetical protein